jgi:hypothetical protein
MACPQYTAIDVNSIDLIRPVEMDKGVGTLVNIVYGPTKQPLRFQAPLMRLAWNIQVMDKFTTPSCVLPIALDEQHEKFRQWLLDVNERLKVLCQQNAMKFFKREMNPGQVEEYFSSPLVKPRKEERYTDTFLPKVPISDKKDDGTYDILVKTFLADSTPTAPKEVLTKGSKAMAVVSLPYIFYAKGAKTISIRQDVESCVVIPALKEPEFIFDVSADPELQAAAEAMRAKRKAEDEEAAPPSTVATTPEPAEQAPVCDAKVDASGFLPASTADDAAVAPVVDGPKKKKAKVEVFDGDDL